VSAPYPRRQHQPDPATALAVAMAGRIRDSLDDAELAMLAERLGRPPKRSHHRKRDDADAGPRPSDPHDAGPRPESIIQGKVIQGEVIHE